MLSSKKKIRFFLISILILCFLLSTKFFKNFQKIVTDKYHQRITNVYDYCKGESVGYLLDLKKKFKIKDNPEIINFIHTPNLRWTIINSKKIIKSNNLILLNYPGPKKEIFLKKISKNIFELESAYFLSDKFKKIEEIHIYDDTDEKFNKNFTILVKKIDYHQNEKNIKIINFKNDNNSKLDIEYPALKLREKIIFKIETENNIKNDKLKLKIVLENKFDLNNFKIIDNFENCYYLKTI